MKKQQWVRKPSVLILHEKHGCRYYQVQDDAQLFEAALTIVSERLKAGRWYGKPEKPAPLDFTEEDVAKMPESLRKEPQRMLSAYKRELRSYQEAMGGWDDIQNAVAHDAEDRELAWDVLRNRSEYEYERVELVGCETVMPREG